MLTKLEQRLFKEAVLAFSSGDPGDEARVAALPWYWLDAIDDQEVSDRAMAQLYQDDRLCLPASPCLLARRDDSLDRVAAVECIMCPTPPAGARFEGHMKRTVGNGGLAGKWLTSVYSVGAHASMHEASNKVVVLPFAQVFIHVRYPTREFMLGVWANIRQASLPARGSSIWISLILYPGREDQAHLRTACDGWFLPLCVPCHYRATSAFVDGFGRPSFRRKTRGKRIFGVIHWNRLHSITSAATERTGDREPGWRRQHWRNLWYLAGIDRRTLPTSPAEKMRIIQEYAVPRTVVRRTWVGPRAGVSEGMPWELDESEGRGDNGPDDEAED
jgi:hypothetical protein